jgi:hypothetical protein
LLIFEEKKTEERVKTITQTRQPNFAKGKEPSKVSKVSTLGKT